MRDRTPAAKASFRASEKVSSWKTPIAMLSGKGRVQVAGWEEERSTGRRGYKGISFLSGWRGRALRAIIGSLDGRDRRVAETSGAARKFPSASDQASTGGSARPPITTRIAYQPS